MAWLRGGMEPVADPGEPFQANRMASGQIVFETEGPGFTDLTASVDQCLEAWNASRGLVNIFIQHTSASLTIQENADPDVQQDLLTALDRMAPRDWTWRHGLEGPDDMPAHIRSMVSDVSLTVPINAGRMALGTWQAVYLVEHRDRPHRRTILLHYIGE